MIRRLLLSRLPSRGMACIRWPTYGRNFSDKASQGDDSSQTKINKLIGELRQSTEPFSGDVHEPDIPADQYKAIQQYQKELRELMKMGEMASAFEVCMQVIDLVCQYYPKSHPVSLSCFNNLAILLRKNGQYTEAKAIQVSVYEGYCQLFGDFHRHSLVALKNLSSMMIASGEVDRAVKTLREILGKAEQVTDSDMSDIKYLCHSELASSLRELGDIDAALKSHETAVSLVKQLYPNNNEVILARLGISKGMTYKRAGNTRAAEKIYTDSLSVLESHYPPHHPEIVAACHNLATLYQETNDSENAEIYLEKVLNALKDK
jgi:tetratricopeptide (TPR) repeat protein